MRTIDPEGLDTPATYKLLTALVVPRPIAWISTLSPDGVPNLAPFSFFTVASSHPPVVQFTAGAGKDTLANVQATGEFVVNVVGRSQLAAMNQTSATVAPEVDEFGLAGVDTRPSHRVRPAQVADAPASLECVLHQVVPVGNSFVVMGRVVCFDVRDEVWDGRHPDSRLIDPVARLGGPNYAALGEHVTLPRPS